MSKKKKIKRKTRHQTIKPTHTLAKEMVLKSQHPKATATLASSTPTLPTTQKERYKYLLTELRQISIIAASLFLILVILTFVLD